MLKLCGLVYLSLFALNLTALAAPVSVCLWQPSASSVKLVIPTNLERAALTEAAFCKTAVQTYVNAVNSVSDLRSMMRGRSLIVSAESKFGFLAKKVSARPSMIIQANQFEQMADPKEFVMSLVFRQFTEAGADVYALPVAAAITLGSQSAEFLKLIVQNFDSMLALGGEDINPALYGQQITTTHAGDVHPVRDAFEAQLYQSYIAGSRGVFYGICRGHQLAAVSQGQKMYQDIYTADRYTTAHTTTAHGDGAWHAIELSPDSIFVKWARTEVKNGKRMMWVNSYHHQAVAFPLVSGPSTKSLKVTGFEQDNPAGGDSRKIIEIIESTDRRYITMQFHPEAMDDDLHQNGLRIRRGMVEHADQMRRR